ncbi:hypothetical protein A2635_01025 [Candidatus Peribacteria bacterium RIFCSPHIGHO2_01_FULL_51_9]|nr:MAG: hypothetical protein A2635_01025 [Candidatus Peribacteria bacterium RIFCSPHIGHO2_01_FULL_51_9]
MDMNPTSTHMPVSGRFVLWSLAGSLLTFSAVFFVVLLLSFLILLSRVTSFGLWGSMLPGQDLHVQRSVLSEEIDSLERAREMSMLSLNDVLYAFLRERKHAQGALQTITRSVQELRARMSHGRSDAIVIDRMVFDRTQDATLRLEGKVQHVGPRSMTLLVSFVEALEQIPFFSLIEQPRFTRIQDATGEFISPFSFVLNTTLE